MKDKNKKRIRGFLPFLFVKPIKLLGPDSALTGFSDTVLAEEETIPGYDASKYFDAEPRKTIGPASRYRLLMKFAYTAHSVTWIAQDLQIYRRNRDRLLAVKIFNNTDADAEQRLEEYISYKNPSDTGRMAIWRCTEKFEVEGPHGNLKHSCLIYEPMREPMGNLLGRLLNSKPSLELAKGQLIFLLAGLDYLHSQCEIVHTDFTPSNIYMSFESEAFLLDKVKHGPYNLCMKHKFNDLTGRHVYGCNKFESLPMQDENRMRPMIGGFQLAHRLGDGNDPGEYNTRIIQRPAFRAPEVILGCSWDRKADIWSFGILAWYLIQGTGLFYDLFDDPSPYQLKAHIADMISLLGPPPGKLLQLSEERAHARWPKPYTDEIGRECWSPWEYFEGPLFDEDGGYVHADLIAARSLEDEVTAVEGQEKHDFVDFMRKMLEWDPERRKTARDLIAHPFLWRGSESGVLPATRFFGGQLPKELAEMAQTFKGQKSQRDLN
ncbi:hypothetical protein FQN50_006429 [Emmonsiellopsis sp. PD_5]|nr:hypothetical protein FQN50_006429 [Emmonsiellopsis sp. PD_5]